MSIDYNCMEVNKNYHPYMYEQNNMTALFIQNFVCRVRVVSSTDDDILIKSNINSKQNFHLYFNDDLIYIVNLYMN
jgi:hypothetical protein